MSTNKTILIVDDDDMVLDSIDLLLSAVDDFQTIRAHGSAAALSQLAQMHRVDVIVADVILRGDLSGIDVCRKAMAKCSGLAVVVITADTEVHRADVPAGAVLLRKPFGSEQLLAAIKDALAGVCATPGS